MKMSDDEESEDGDTDVVEEEKSQETDDDEDDDLVVKTFQIADPEVYSGLLATDEEYDQDEDAMKNRQISEKDINAFLKN